VTPRSTDQLAMSSSCLEQLQRKSPQRPKTVGEEARRKPKPQTGGFETTPARTGWEGLGGGRKDQRAKGRETSPAKGERKRSGQVVKQRANKVRAKNKTASGQGCKKTLGLGKKGAASRKRPSMGEGGKGARGARRKGGKKGHNLAFHWGL